MRRMKVIGFAIVLACLLTAVTPVARAASSPSDAGWPTLASGVGARGIDFVDPAHGWVAGPAGFVYRTSDGGTTWIASSTGTRATLLAVDFVDGQSGWAVGGEGTVVVTHDGGVTWSPQVAPAVSAFTGVSFSDGSRGWAVTEDSLWETSDGGRTWLVGFEADALYRLTTVQFVDAQHGWAAGLRGDRSVVLRTVDGGRTWTPIETGGYLGYPMRSIDFVDTMNGWGVSGPGVQVTHDGGLTWEGQYPQQTSNSPGYVAVSFADPLHGFVVGLDTFRTSDGGRTWVVQNPPLRGGLGVVAVSATSVRATSTGNVIVTSDDGGQTWASHRLTATSEKDLNAVHFVDSQHGWVVGESGVIRRTDDSGVTWVDQASGTTEPLQDVTFTDLQHGAAVGGLDSSTDRGHGVILTTSDGGATWTRRAAATAAPEFYLAVYFLDSLHGWVAGLAGVEATSDGGQTWTSLGYFPGAADVFFLDLQHGYVAASGKVHVTSDGGATWTARNPLATVVDFDGPRLLALRFTDPLHGWVAGGRYFIRTADGGLTWTANQLWTNTNGDPGVLNAVEFRTPTDGWAVTSRGYAVHTDDGGGTWRLVATSASDYWRSQLANNWRSLNDLSFPAAGPGWAVGPLGHVVQASVMDEATIRLTSASSPAAGYPVVLDVELTGRTVGGIGASPGTPTGVVEFGLDGSVLGTAVAVGGRARLTTPPLGLGRHVFFARYLGDARFAATSIVGLRMFAPRPVRGWGFNRVGSLGTGTSVDSSTPVRSTAAPAKLVVSAAAGGFHTLAVTDDGALYSWGYNPYGQLGLGGTDDRLVPSRVNLYIPVRQVAAGAFHSLTVTAFGEAWAWGWNGFGQLGTTPSADPTRPAPVLGLPEVRAVAAGAAHSLALGVDGTVWAWGWNGLGQLGDGTTTSRPAPVRVSGLTGVVAIAAGSHHSLALKADGSVWAWGWNIYGQLGDGSTIDRLVPVRVPGLSARSVSGGAYHSLAARTDGTVAAWGWNGVGQLGDGTTVDRHSPVTVAGVSGITTVAAGAYHGLALDGGGAVRAWGWNYFGQLGDGTTTDRRLAVPVPGILGQSLVVAGSIHSEVL